MEAAILFAGNPAERLGYGGSRPWEEEHEIGVSHGSAPEERSEEEPELEEAAGFFHVGDDEILHRSAPFPEHEAEAMESKKIGRMLRVTMFTGSAMDGAVGSMAMAVCSRKDEDEDEDPQRKQEEHRPRPQMDARSSFRR
jgi:hypothetical protein